MPFSQPESRQIEARLDFEQPDQGQVRLEFERDIWTVSRLNAEVRAVLSGSFPLLWVQGELSNLSQPASGHLYFTLKDAGAQVRCAMFRSRRRLLNFAPAAGQQVLVRARVGLYEPRGDFQLVAEQMEPAGEGALRLELERRRQRLAAEGLFDAALKRPLPAFPRQIGLITSGNGAALHDLLTVLGRRLPLVPVILYPAQVQGAGSPESLRAALALANRRAEVDLLILARGGGALEDLMAFNDEQLVRDIRASGIPIITGVGHEVDLTLADLAADQRGATPSAAAELAVPAATDLAHRITRLSAGLSRAFNSRLLRESRRLEALTRQLRLLHPAARLQQQAQRLDDGERRLRVALELRMQRQRYRLQQLEQRLVSQSPALRLQRDRARFQGLTQRLDWALRQSLSDRKDRLALAAGGLQARSPLATLARGYALVTLPDQKEALVRDSRQVPVGSKIAVRLHRGQLQARVEDVE